MSRTIPIKFRGSEYKSVKEAIEKTGISRHLINKECVFLKDRQLSGGRSSKVSMPEKDELEDIYNRLVSIRKTARHFSVSDSRVKSWLSEYGIPVIDLSTAIQRHSDKKRPSRKELESIYLTKSYQETQDRFGVGHTLLDRWLKELSIPKKPRGETRRVKSEARRENIKPTSQTLSCLYERYSIHDLASTYGVDKGVIREWLNEYEIDIVKQASREEKKLLDFCQSIDSSFRSRDRSIISPFELDIVSDEFKLAIEYCGVYWHSSKFKDKRYHQNKLNACLEKGYDLITVFESDSMEKVRSLISSKLGQTSKVYARHTEARVITDKEARDFHAQHHLMGAVKSKYNMGLFNENQLLMVASFSKSRFSKSGEIECTRMTSHSDHQVLGGVSKLMKNAREEFGFDEMITYADRRFGEGKSYLSCDFEYVGSTGPGFFYFGKDQILESRFALQKHKLPAKLREFDPNLTAEENIARDGYLKIYDCGHNIYKWKKG